MEKSSGKGIQIIYGFELRSAPLKFLQHKKQDICTIWAWCEYRPMISLKLKV